MTGLSRSQSMPRLLSGILQVWEDDMEQETGQIWLHVYVAGSDVLYMFYPFCPKTTLSGLLLKHVDTILSF